MTYEFPHPDRMVADALDPIGERSFVIQIRQEEHMAVVDVQREAALSITRRIDFLLRGVAALGWLGGPPETDPELGPSDTPIEVLFNVGAIDWALDTRKGATQLRFYPNDQDVQETAIVVQVWLYPGAIKQFATHVRIIAVTADPSHPFCSQPAHAARHICPHNNSCRAPLL